MITSTIFNRRKNRRYIKLEISVFGMEDMGTIFHLALCLYALREK